MKYISEKVAYTKGLMAGLEIDESTNKGKVLCQVMEILEDVVDALDGLSEGQADLESYIEMVDDDLSDLEEFILDEEYLDDDDAFEDDDYYEVICPECGHVYITEFDSFEDDSVACPECGEPFILDEAVTCCGEDGCDCHQEV